MVPNKIVSIILHAVLIYAKYKAAVYQESDPRN